MVGVPDRDSENSDRPKGSNSASLEDVLRSRMDPDRFSEEDFSSLSDWEETIIARKFRLKQRYATIDGILDTEGDPARLVLFFTKIYEIGEDKYIDASPEEGDGVKRKMQEFRTSIGTQQALENENIIMIEFKAQRWMTENHE